MELSEHGLTIDLLGERRSLENVFSLVKVDDRDSPFGLQAWRKLAKVGDSVAQLVIGVTKEDPIRARRSKRGVIRGDGPWDDVGVFAGIQGALQVPEEFLINVGRVDDAAGTDGGGQ